MDVLLKMAHSLSDTDPLKQYLLLVITDLKFKLDKPLEIHKRVGDLPDNNILIKDFSNIPAELINVSGVYVLYHKEKHYFYIGSASSLSTRFKQHILNSSRSYRGGNSKLYSFVKENGGWDSMEGQAILTTPNHIIKFLDSEKIIYFLDDTNYTDKYKRNIMRKKISLLSEIEKKKNI